ncbi:extracellular calcium-sensing receptor-like protein [Labeo rohita]|uniref:Extracellular calcium-sensing receptor-like protein n=1 Tax=Labeo rohita TaxID=84645 RepID=A0A498LT24_LABRO|nr:extracellular calcium-sensing receptor-like protein [Labeo rohita]RXN28353.1 extracellular calcium-sensing receptor-like protein [Labeo rohita]
MMPQVEETFASYLSHGSSSSLKKPMLPTKPCRLISSLVGKAYQAAGQAGAALHTMAVLQAYQADLLKDLSTGGTIDEEAFVRFLPRLAQASGLSATQSRTGLVSLRRNAQKESVASRAPPHKDWGTAHRTPQSASKRPDLRSILSKKKSRGWCAQDRGALMASSGTCKLQGHFTLNGMYQDGDFLIGGLFEVQYLKAFPELSFTMEPKLPHCELFYMTSFQQARTMVFAINEINNNPSLLPNITLGYQIFDNCVRLGVAFRGAIALASGTEETISDLSCKGPPPVIGIIGDPGSTHSIAISSVLGLFRVPMVSFYATCSCLSNRKKYPSFFRTIPSDAFQVRAMVQILRHFGWTWVGLIYSDDDYGVYAAQAFQQEMQLFGLCAAFSEFLPHDNNLRDIQRIMEVIQSSTARVVVVFAPTSFIIPLMNEVVLQNMTGRQWIASEAWATSPMFHTSRFHPFLGGTLTIAIRHGEIQGLRDFLLRLRPNIDQRNIMVRIFWEKIFGCRFETESKETDGEQVKRVCTGLEDLNTTNTPYTDVSGLRASYNVYKAVYAMAHALHDLMQCEKGRGPFSGNSCADMSNLKPWQLVHYLQTVNFTTGFGDHVSFDKNGDAVAIYDVLNWQPSSDDATECIICPDELWSSPNKNQCVPKEIEFLSYEDPLGISLTTASLLGTCFCALVLVIFAYHRHTPIVRANNSELSFLLLLSLKLCFLCVLLFIGKPQLWTCQLRHAVFGISFVLCISSILVKTMVVVAVFKSSRPEGKGAMKWFEAAQQRCTVLVLTALQIVICAIWLSTASPTPYKNNQYIRSKIVYECAIGSVAGFSMLLGYIGILAAVSFLLAFLARKLPDNFNEAKFITFSMLIFCAVWITFVPAYVSSPGKYAVAMEIFAILASSFGLLVAIFAPKCYIILLHPERNTKKAIMGRQTQK